MLSPYLETYSDLHDKQKIRPFLLVKKSKHPHLEQQILRIVILGLICFFDILRVTNRICPGPPRITVSCATYYTIATIVLAMRPVGIEPTTCQLNRLSRV